MGVNTKYWWGNTGGGPNHIGRLVAEQQDEKGCYDGAVLANSDISPTLYVTLMSAKDSPVPKILTLPEVEPTSVWMLNELKMHRDP